MKSGCFCNTPWYMLSRKISFGSQKCSMALEEEGMDAKEFHLLRQKLQKTQKEMSQLLGTSLRGVQSFEQGWRRIPVPIERQVLFLWALKKKTDREVRPCWQIRGCPAQTYQSCPAWEFNTGQFCWFISGTICRGKVQESWSKKMRVCRRCPVFAANMKF